MSAKAARGLTTTKINNRTRQRSFVPLVKTLSGGVAKRAPDDLAKRCPYYTERKQNTGT